MGVTSAVAPGTRIARYPSNHRYVLPVDVPNVRFTAGKFVSLNIVT